MKKEYLIFLAFGLGVLFFWVSPLARPVKWLEETPRILSAEARSLRAVFVVDGPATIYWRILPSESPAPHFQDFVNTNVEGLSAYGGGVLRGGAYTNEARGLLPGKSYVLYGAAVTPTGLLRGEVKALPFSTPSSED